MKKIEIICIGRIKESYFADAIKEYAKRLSRYCVLSVVELKEEGDDAQAVKKESAAIVSRLGGTSVLLDLKGIPVSSEELAAYIDTVFSQGAKKLQFIIGGSGGVDESVKTTAHKSIAFGRITYPHQLMRVIALEQVYRALCILENTPYHK